MELKEMEYVVESIQGEYAYLLRIDEEESSLKCVAMALLPPQLVEGSRLHYNYMEYTMI